MRLMRLLETRILDIIRRERANDTSICLYSTGTYWVGFEHSAWQLSRLFPSASDTSVATHPAYPFPVVMTSVSAERLRDYFCRHDLPYVSEKPDYREISSDSFDSAEYEKWHKREVEEFL